MPEVPEQCAIRLVQVVLDLLALDVVGFFDIHGDEAVGVAGHHGRPFRRRAQEIEHHTAFGRFLDPGLHRKPEREQLRHEAPLGHFYGPPVARVVGVSKIRDRTVETAGNAKRSRIARVEHPVAQRRRLAIATAFVAAIAAVEAQHAGLGAGVERDQRQGIRQITQLRRAIQALGVAKEDCRAAAAVVGTGEPFVSLAELPIRDQPLGERFEQFEHDAPQCGCDRSFKSMHRDGTSRSGSQV